MDKPIKLYGDRIATKYSDWDLIDSYVTLESIFEKYPMLDYCNPENWTDCPECESKPKIWSFNNGNYACCKCYSKYGNHDVEAINILEYLNQNDGSAEGYQDDQLMKNWNKRCIDLFFNI
jgi:hypothetical protein